MPIDIDEFEEVSGTEDFLRGGEKTVDEQVLEYLAYHSGKAFSREEIQAATNLSALDVLSALSRLENDGPVRHKGQYWAISEENTEELDAVADG